MDIVFKGSPNFNKRTKPVKKIVIHWFGSGTLESANTRFQNAANQVSAHYGISKGRVWQWVKESDVAWHSGNASVNGESIGIEHDAILNGHNLSEGDYQLSGQLIAEIAKRHNIPLSRSTVIGHKEVKATACPGTVDIDKIIKIANQYLNPMPAIKMHLTVVANNINWPSLESQLMTVAEWVKTYSRDRINLTFDVKATSFNSIPFDEALGIKGVETNWYREYITPLASGHVSLFLMNADQWQGYGRGAMTWGDPGKPGRISLMLLQDWFVSDAFHELCHAFLFFTGQRDGYVENGNQWVVHDYLYQNPPKYYELLDTLDYPKLQSTLNGITPEGASMPKYFKVNDHGKLGIMILEGFSGSVIFENEFADYQDLLRITEGTENAPTVNIP